MRSPRSTAGNRQGVRFWKNGRKQGNRAVCQSLSTTGGNRSELAGSRLGEESNLARGTRKNGRMPNDGSHLANQWEDGRNSPHFEKDSTSEFETRKVWLEGRLRLKNAASGRIQKKLQAVTGSRKTACHEGKKKGENESLAGGRKGLSQRKEAADLNFDEEPALLEGSFINSITVAHGRRQEQAGDGVGKKAEGQTRRSSRRRLQNKKAES